MATEIATRSPAFVDGKTQNAQELRLHAVSSGGGATPLASRGGTRPSGGQPGLVAALATPVMKVRVNAGIADIPSTSASGGVYRVSWDQVDLDIDPSSAQARTDLVIVEVVDTGTSAATGKVRILKGTPGAGRPTNPVANAHWMALASVAVRINAESTGNIRSQDVTPERRFAVAPGGIMPVTADDTAAGVMLGDYRDHPTRGLERWDGSRWSTIAPGGEWVNQIYTDTYNTPLGGVANPPSMGGLATIVPPGRTLDVELSAHAGLAVATNGYAHLYMGPSTDNIVRDAASFSTNGATGYLDRFKISGSWRNAADTDVNCQWSILAACTTGSIALQAGPNGRLRLRYRIR